MGLFTELYSLTTQATIALIISGDHDAGLMTINVFPKPKDRHDEPALCRDLTLVAPPAEFDANFLEALRGYVAARTDLLEQAKTTVRVLETATKASTASANAKSRHKREDVGGEAVTPPAKEPDGAVAPSKSSAQPLIASQSELFE